MGGCLAACCQPPARCTMWSSFDDPVFVPAEWNQKPVPPNYHPQNSTISYSTSWGVGPAGVSTSQHLNSSERGANNSEFVHVSGNDWKEQVAPTKATTVVEEEISGQNLYKTELCRSFEDTGTCRYGIKCQFAHGKAEIRPVLRHPKYKTEFCKTFHTQGTCPYGRRCRFIHSTAEEISVKNKTVQKQQKETSEKLLSTSSTSKPFDRLQSSPNYFASQSVSHSIYTPVEPLKSYQGEVVTGSASIAPTRPLPVLNSSTTSYDHSRYSDPSDSSWIDAMGSLTISQPEFVQLVIPDQTNATPSNLDNSFYDSHGRLSFFQSITSNKTY